MLETRRKTCHIITGVTVVLLHEHGYIGLTHLLILLALGSILTALSLKFKIPFIHFLLKTFGRPGERPPARGALSMVAGIIIALYLFEPAIAYASILILAFGDAFTGLIGHSLRNTTHVKKTKNPFSEFRLVEATIFGIIMGTLTASIYVSITEAFLASGAAMFIESIEFKFDKHLIDDNLLIPLTAGLILTLIAIM